MYETAIAARNAWSERRRAQVDAGVPCPEQERCPADARTPALPFSPLTGRGLVEALRERCFTAYYPPQAEVLDLFELQSTIVQRIEATA